MEFGKKYAVFSVKKAENSGASIWVRAGYAWANRDGSANVALDVLPLDGDGFQATAGRGGSPRQSGGLSA